jgi:hypothetical protein
MMRSRIDEPLVGALTTCRFKLCLAVRRDISRSLKFPKRMIPQGIGCTASQWWKIDIPLVTYESSARGCTY